MLLIQYGQNRPITIFFDENGKIVYLTSGAVRVGDQCINENNQRYEIIEVSENAAKAKFIEYVELSSYFQPEDKQNIFWGLLASSISLAQDKGKFARYHTHSDESYVPIYQQMARKAFMAMAVYIKLEILYFSLAKQRNRGNSFRSPP